MPTQSYPVVPNLFGGGYTIKKKHYRQLLQDIEESKKEKNRLAAEYASKLAQEKKKNEELSAAIAKERESFAKQKKDLIKRLTVVQESQRKTEIKKSVPVQAEIQYPNAVEKQKLLDRIYLNEDLCYELENRHKKLYDWYLDIDDDLLDLENRYNALQIDLVNQKKENAVMKKTLEAIEKKIRDLSMPWNVSSYRY